jgi:hypothetical protein
MCMDIIVRKSEGKIVVVSGEAHLDAQLNVSAQAKVTLLASRREFLVTRNEAGELIEVNHRNWGAKYVLEITGKYLNEDQVWSYVGEDKMGNGLLTNTAKYAKDATITIDKNLNVVGGYSFLVNSETSIKVSVFA